jgi:hypothetical protein
MLRIIFYFYFEIANFRAIYFHIENFITQLSRFFTLIMPRPPDGYARVAYPGYLAWSLDQYMEYFHHFDLKLRLNRMYFH